MFESIKLKYIAKLNPSKSEINNLEDIEVSFLPMEKIIGPNKIDLSIVKNLEVVYSGYTYFKNGDIVLAKVTPCFENGNIAVVEGLKNEIGFGTTELHVLRVDQKHFNTKYVYYCLQSEDFKTEAVANMYGVGGLKRIPTEFLSEFKFLVPAKHLQDKIVNYLDSKLFKLDKIIENKIKLLGLLEQQSQSIITEAVTKGLNPNGKMKDSGVEWIGEVPDNWSIMPFRRITNLQQGLQIAQEERFYEPASNRMEYITVKSLHYKDHVTEYVENPSSRVVCNKGEVLLARTGATGLVVTNVEGVFHNNFFKVNFDATKITKEFLVFYLKQKLIQEHFQLVAGTTTIPDLNHGAFYDTVVLLPSIDEQNEIVTFLNSELLKYEQLITKNKLFLEKLKEYRQSLIYEAVTGKIDICELELE